MDQKCAADVGDSAVWLSVVLLRLADWLDPEPRGWVWKWRSGRVKYSVPQNLVMLLFLHLSSIPVLVPPQPRYPEKKISTARASERVKSLIFLGGGGSFELYGK
jgi:hypothetical protein